MNFNQLSEEVRILPVLIFDAVLNHRYFDYKYLSKRKKSIQQFLNMNGESSKWTKN